MTWNSSVMKHVTREIFHFLGIPQIVSNINACQVIGEAIKTTLGPRGLDKMIIDQREKVCYYIISRYLISILVSHFK